MTGQITDRPYRAAEMRELAVRFRLNLPANFELHQLTDLFDKMLDSEEFDLDLLDATLDVLGPNANDWEKLQHHLSIGASAWRVADDHISLTRVVADEVQATLEAATSVADDAAAELREAWANAFGRNGDPSDAWDHAIKAVEDVLVPSVLPNQQNATLGSVLGHLRSQGGLWEMILPGQDRSNGVGPLVAMLELIWPNHDRHGGAGPRRAPTPQEARAVVTLAATIVQWHREGWVVRRR
ncbi:hypothetical protein PT015_07735 [Candidatus Mycobacterium wuenschmannii]|uniref:Uncharacterized protein n=1 Tax=Candidatus Mycobacterium wuenschmannii TaxID=3027808 RepID=A0ABY8W0D7_9MYCO|nr:hypothetical protein [Candidatus Mycobacterium wuenschmannii]WIM89323.1 hypothetical protein PT015_07735 [Candidatus Mycobacterium wuenschmannii]